MILNFGHIFTVMPLNVIIITTNTPTARLLRWECLKLRRLRKSFGMTKSGTSERLSALLKNIICIFPNVMLTKNAAHDIIIKDKKATERQ